MAWRPLIDGFGIHGRAPNYTHPRPCTGGSALDGVKASSSLRNHRFPHWLRAFNRLNKGGTCGTPGMTLIHKPLLTLMLKNRKKRRLTRGRCFAFFYPTAVSGSSGRVRRNDIRRPALVKQEGHTRNVKLRAKQTYLKQTRP